MLRNYLLTAFKVFQRRKFFTFISLFAISFTLIVMMVAVALIDHVFGVHAPETKQSRTLGVFFCEMKSPDGQNMRTGTPGYGFLTRYVKSIKSAEKFSILTEGEDIQTFREGERVPLRIKRTDGNFWEVLDFTFIEGGPYSQDDDNNRNNVAVINRATRDKLFGGNSAIGRTVELDGSNFRIVGVVENVPFLRYVPYSDVWVPIGSIKNDSFRQELIGDFIGLILAHSRADFPAISDEFQTKVKSIEFPDPTNWNTFRAAPETYFDFISREIVGSANNAAPGKLLAAILLAAFLFMLLPTINLANINVSRIMERSSEIGVRKAFGASSTVLIGQFIVENLVLTLIGGVIAWLGSALILYLISISNYFPYAHFSLNYRIFLAGFAVSIIFGLVSGVYPAWRMSRLHPVNALKS